MVLDGFVNSSAFGVCKRLEHVPPGAAEMPVSTWFIGGRTWLLHQKCFAALRKCLLSSLRDRFGPVLQGAGFAKAVSPR